MLKPKKVKKIIKDVSISEGEAESLGINLKILAGIIIDNYIFEKNKVGVNIQIND